MEPYYLTVGESINLIDEPHQRACRKILYDNLQLFKRVQGSTNNHQAWPGGYLEHVQETMNIVRVLYNYLKALRRFRFSLSDALLVMFLHDIEKPWKYQVGADGKLEHIPTLRTKEAQHAFREAKLTEYGIVLTDEQQNALRYVEGELNDYTNLRRVMGPLAALCHMADIASARIWFDYPTGHWGW